MLAFAPVLLLLTNVAIGEVPTAIDLAQALTRSGGQVVSARELRHLRCRPFDEEPTEAVCRWQQRHADRWRHYETVLALDASGWVLIDTPGP